MNARQTFLRRHVARGRALDADTLGWEGLEVFRTLRRHPAAPPPTLRAFFHGTDALPPLYRPVPVEPHPGDEGGDARHDLSALLAHLHSTHHPRGVLLLGPGGAGKSVSMRRAFFDCLDDRTALGNTGLVPCWLSLTRTDAGVGLPDLFRHAVAPLDVGEPAVWDWLDAGPPVLLLCDLDDPAHVPPDRRAALAARLAALQASDTFARRHHRVVVAYRSAGALCPVAGTLHAAGFRRHRLLELEPDAVLSYLTDLRAWSAALSGESPAPADDVAWCAFAERMERRPLLMHLLGSFFLGPPGPPPTAGHLVARLVEDQLNGALRRLPAGLLDRLPTYSQRHNLRHWMLTGLSRVCRAGWASGQPATPTLGQHLYDVLQDPHAHLPAWPASDYWHAGGSPYWHNEPGLAQYLFAMGDLIQGAPWVSRPDDEHYRVGPALFVNFFAAVLPTRYRQGPPFSLANAPTPLPDAEAWPAEVVALWREQAEAWAGEPGEVDAWQQGAALLAGLLNEQDYFALVRAWLLSGDAGLLRLGLSLMHGRHPHDPPTPPQCPPGLLCRLRDALAEATQTGFVADPLTVCHELLGEPNLAAFAGGPPG